MALKKNVRRIDHIAILISPHSFEDCVQRLSRALEVEFTLARRDDMGLLIAIDWDSGLELLAPTGPESPLWSRLQEKGEGHVSIIFGVGDVDEAKRRAESAGFVAGAEIGLIGDEPWAARFERLREIPLSEICGINLVLGQVEPRY
jgi:hypothetical protein